MKRLNKIQSSLSSAVSTTMESMTFEEIEMVDEDEIQISEDEQIWSTLPIALPYAGELVVRIRREYGRVLADEVMGFMDEDVSETTINDNLAEIANTIAGRFMDDLVSEYQGFELGLPATGAGNLIDDSSVAATIPIRIGEYEMIVSVRGRDFVELLEKA